MGQRTNPKERGENGGLARIRVLTKKLKKINLIVDNSDPIGDNTGMKDKTIKKLDLIDELVPQVIESWTQDDLIQFAANALNSDYQSDFDQLIEDAITFGLIEDEEQIV